VHTARPSLGFIEINRKQTAVPESVAGVSDLSWQFWILIVLNSLSFDTILPTPTSLIEDEPTVGPHCVWED
jgi:hypothetical protein